MPSRNEAPTRFLNKLLLQFKSLYYRFICLAIHPNKCNSGSGDACRSMHGKLSFSLFKIFVVSERWISCSAIFLQLDFFTLCLAGQVCKLWAVDTNQPFIWKHLLHTDYPQWVSGNSSYYYLSSKLNRGGEVFENWYPQSKIESALLGLTEAPNKSPLTPAAVLRDADNIKKFYRSPYRS